MLPWESKERITAGHVVDVIKTFPSGALHQGNIPKDALKEPFKLKNQTSHLQLALGKNGSFQQALIDPEKPGEAPKQEGISDQLEQSTIENFTTLDHTREEFQEYFTKLGLSQWFFERFMQRKLAIFGDSESDIGWIRLMMREIYDHAENKELESINTAEGLEKLGYTSDEATVYGEFIDSSTFKDSESLIGWALLKISNSGLFDYLTGNYVQTPHGYGSSRSSGRCCQMV
jgi:hypothetical protein